MQQATPEIYQEDPDFSFGQKLGHWFNKTKRLLQHHWRKLVAGAVAGTVLGCIYANFKSVTYTASMSFVMEDAKASGASLMSALTGQFGIDLGGLTGNNGLLAGDNIQALVKSPTLVKKTLFSPYADTGTYSLADRFAEVYHLKEKWQQSKKVARLVQFPVNGHFNRQDDSLIQCMVKTIIENYISIGKPDKKLNIFELKVTLGDERLSQLLCERLLNSATSFYINTKTSRLKTNVDRLQHRADSIGVLLNKKTFSATESDLLLLDANPAYAGPAAYAEISSRDKYLLTTIYGEIVKNLELSKTALAQETPVVQVIDYPELPLKRNKTEWYMAAAAGAFLLTAGLFLLLFLLDKQKVELPAKH